RVVPSHLERQDSLGMVDQRAIQRLPASDAAREENPVDPIMFPEGSTGLAPALNQIDDAAWKTHLPNRRIPRFDHELADERGLFTRFEDRGVSGEQCRHQMPVRQMTRHIERPKYRHDAMRPKASGSLSASLIALDHAS